MTTNTDPVRAHDELRVQAALLRTPEFMAQFDPEKFARQLERIATALASAPPSAPEPEVHSYDPTEHRESVTIRWPDGKCLGYVLDRTRYTDNLPPSAPVGVDLSNWAQHYSIGAAALEALRNLLSLAQQPAAVAVDDAMVDRAGQELYGTDWGAFDGWEADQLRRKVRAVLTAALAQQQGGAE